MTIPRFELCGAQLLSKLLTDVKNALNIDYSLSFAWTDRLCPTDWMGAPNISKCLWATVSRQFLNYFLQVHGGTCPLQAIQLTVLHADFCRKTFSLIHCGGKDLPGYWSNFPSGLLNLSLLLQSACLKSRQCVMQFL